MEERLSAPICGRGNDLISFLYGEANEDEARDFERHLRNCAECKSELGSFRQIRESVVAWRQESLGVVPAHAAGSSGTAAVPAIRAVEASKPSAMTAIREFLNLSPLWLKGAVAFASVLLCVVAIGAVARLAQKQQPAPVVAKRVFTEEELKTKIEEGVQARLQELNAKRNEVLPAHVVDQNDRRERTDVIVASRSREMATKGQGARRRPLTKTEREQLAADLRLISPKDEADLDLLGDRLNR